MTYNDTKLCWTDADLADAVYNADAGAKSWVIEQIQPHLEVCNYRAVTEEACDVCHWVETTIRIIKDSQK